MRHEVQSCNGNVEALDSTTILTTSSGVARRNKQDEYDLSMYDSTENAKVIQKYTLNNCNVHENETEKMLREFLNFHDQVPEQLDEFCNNSVAYLCGFVVRTLVILGRPSIDCVACKAALLQESQSVALFAENMLLETKTRGSLIFPSISVVKLCARAEKCLRKARNVNNSMPILEPNFPAVVCDVVVRSFLSGDCTIFNDLHENDSIHFLRHKENLCKLVCKIYIKNRLFAFTKDASELAVGTKLRHYMTRTIVWKNQ